MKREGRQHGMVRTHPILPQPFNPRPVTGYVNELCSPPTAGVFTKVSSKPTNHSKFTGKCLVHRVSKAKGAQKRGSIVSRVVDANPGFKLSDSSASDILDQLIDPYVDEYYDDDDDVEDKLFEEKVRYGYEVLYGHHWTETRFGSSWEECDWSCL